MLEISHLNPSGVSMTPEGRISPVGAEAVTPPGREAVAEPAAGEEVDRPQAVNANTVMRAEAGKVNFMGGF